MKREFSAGGIVLRQAQDKYSKNTIQVLITQHSTNKYWGFPKGHIEAGQTAQEAALREVEEEGGIKAEIVKKVGQSKYVFTQPETNEKVFKAVTLFLMKYVSGDIKDHDWEVSEALWLTPDEALDKLSFVKDKELLKEALNLYTP